jgi:Spy/CpxP family protein refolding chaperone
MKNLTSWLLGGALAASLTWNLRHASEREPECATASCAGMDPAALGLDAKQRAALEELCGRSCSQSDRLEREADAKQRELLARLSRPELDTAALHDLVSEVAELRRRALEACVQGVVSVREVLTAEQVRVLLAQCGEGSCARSE